MRCLEITFDLNRNTRTKTLKGGNEMISANDSLHHQVRAAIVKHLRHKSCKAVKPLISETRSKQEPCTVTITVNPPTRRRMDTPNWYPTVKALLDGFTDAGVWEDDDNTIIKALTFIPGELSQSTKYKITIKIDDYM